MHGGRRGVDNICEDERGEFFDAEEMELEDGKINGELETARTDDKDCKVDEEGTDDDELGYGDKVNRKIFDRKRLVGQKL